ncbi:MAG: S26 family signal peptidase [Silvibacterium sp.]|nr:S26 family signal peptidase [Silvibacterium sp.]
MQPITRNRFQLSGMRNAVLMFLAALCLGIPLFLKSSHLRVNYTDSVPLGLYLEVRGPAEYAGLCLAQSTIESAIKAGLEIAGGDCPTGVAPILKPVFHASADNPIVYRQAGFFVSRKLLLNTAPKERSRTGTPLSHYPFGEYRSGLWAISDYNRDSFDSRYFGPVDPSTVRFYAKPVWTK